MSLLGTSQQWKHRTGFPQQRPFHYTRTRYEAILRSRSALAPLAAEGAIAASNGHVSHFWNAIGYRAMSTAAEAPAAAAPVSQPGAAPAGGSAPPPPPPPPKKPNIFQRAGAMISAFNQRVQPAKWARRAFFLFILLRIADSQRRQKEFLTVKDGTLVRWRLDKLSIDEQPPIGGIKEAFARSSMIGGLAERFMTLHDFLQALRDMEADDRVSGLVLDLASAGQFSARGGIGFAQAQEIRDALLNLRRAKAEKHGEGKFLMVAYTDTFESQIGYYLASVFDEIRAEPMGSLPLFGFGSTQPFFRNLLDRLKIQVRTFTREQFKSVLANVQGTGYSPDIKANMLSMLKSLNQQFLEGIAQGRAGRIRMVDAAKIFEEIKKGKVAERGDVEVSELMQKAAPAMDNVAQGVLAAIGAPISMARKALQNGPMQPVGEAFFPAHDFLNEQEMDQSVDFVRKLVNHGTLTAKEALKAGMIDALKYRRDIVQWFLGDAWEGQVRIKAHEEQGPTGMLGDIVLGLRPRKPQVESMSIFRYKVARDYELQRRKKRWAPNPLVPAKDPATGANSKTQKTRLNNNRMVVGMVYLTGGISRGDGPAGGNHVVKAMSEAGRDNDVEAIVLRIDSGGGDALASDTIWEAVKSVRDATGKPVIASMGNMCASGGYYAASGADLIMAMPGTITGSIGVASARPFLTPEFLDKLGITTDDIMTTDSAKLVSIFHDIDAEEIAKTERNIEAMYRVFRRRVAESRGWDKLPEAEVEKKLDEVTGGRVFTGVQAKENGLVDELGGIDAAVSRAVQMGLAQRTKLLPDKVRDALTGLATPPEPEIVDIRIYPVQPSFFSLLLGDNNQSLEENLVKLGKQTMTSLARWFVAGHGMWEMEQAMLDAGERAEVSMKAGRGQMAMDAKISL